MRPIRSGLLTFATWLANGFVYGFAADGVLSVFDELLRRTANLNTLSSVRDPVSYTHLTLPTICSV